MAEIQLETRTKYLLFRTSGDVDCRPMGVLPIDGRQLAVGPPIY
jgi:hypothetical protein